jgi:hypothetical protein
LSDRQLIFAAQGTRTKKVTVQLTSDVVRGHAGGRLLDLRIERLFMS